MREIRTSGLMSGDGKRGAATAPILDSTRPYFCTASRAARWARRKSVHHQYSRTRLQLRRLGRRTGRARTGWRSEPRDAPPAALRTVLRRLVVGPGSAVLKVSWKSNDEKFEWTRQIPRLERRPLR